MSHACRRGLRGIQLIQTTPHPVAMRDHPLPRVEGEVDIGARCDGMKAAHEFPAGNSYDFFLTICAAGDNRNITCQFINPIGIKGNEIYEKC